MNPILQMYLFSYILLLYWCIFVFLGTDLLMNKWICKKLFSGLPGIQLSKSLQNCIQGGKNILPEGSTLVKVVRG